MRWLYGKRNNKNKLIIDKYVWYNKMIRKKCLAKPFVKINKAFKQIFITGSNNISWCKVNCKTIWIW